MKRPQRRRETFRRTKLYAGSVEKKNPSINVRRPEVNGSSGTFWRQRVAEIINLLAARRACRCNNHRGRRCRDVSDNP